MKKWSLVFLFISVYCSSLAQNKADSSQQRISPDIVISYKIISVTNGTWGYDIYTNLKVTIHQPTIPGRPGNEGFKSKEDADKVAKLVIEKMKKGELPPTIKNEDLKKLGI